MHRYAVALFALSFAPLAHAAENVIQMRPGSQHILNLSEPFTSVSVGNPDVVDVMPKSNQVLLIVARRSGSSDIVLFFDSKPIYSATAAVGLPRPEGRVYSHGKRLVHEYWSYECNPVCVRVTDRHEGAVPPPPIIVEGGSSSSTINVLMPPAPPAPR